MPAPAADPASDPGVRAPDAAPLDFDTLYDRYARYVARILIRLTGGDEEVDDLVQDVFMLAARGLPTIRDPAAVPAWLATIAVRRVHRKLWSRRLRNIFRVSDPIEEVELAAPGCSPEDRLLLKRVFVVLDRVAVRDRIAWTLHVLEGETLETVAQACRCSLSTAKRRIASAQAKIDKEVGHA